MRTLKRCISCNAVKAMEPLHALTAPDEPALWSDDVAAKLMDGSLTKSEVTGRIVRVANSGQAGEVSDVDRENRRIFHWISSKNADRSRDVIKQEGIDFGPFNTNPVWMLSHDYAQLPIGRSVDHGTKNGKAFSVVEFWSGDTEHGDLCETVFQMTAQKFFNACSVGGRLQKFSLNEKRRGLDIEELELFEVSKVAIPDQPAALAKAKQAGISVNPLLGWMFKNLEEAQADGLLTDTGIWLAKAKADALAEAVGYGSGLELISVDPAKLADFRSTKETPKMEFKEATEALVKLARAEEGDRADLQKQIADAYEAAENPVPWEADAEAWKRFEAGAKADDAATSAPLLIAAGLNEAPEAKAAHAVTVEVKGLDRFEAVVDKLADLVSTKNTTAEPAPESGNWAGDITEAFGRGRDKASFRINGRAAAGEQS